MYATDKLVDRRIGSGRSLDSGRYVGSGVSDGVFRDDYERMLGQQELMQMLGKQRGYVLPQAPRVEYPKQENAGSYQWKNSAPVPMDKLFASAYKRN